MTSYLYRLFLFLLFLLGVPALFAQNIQNGFESAEHVFLGNEVALFFSPNDPGQTHRLLHMPNGLNLSYGDIVTLGDFYEIPNQPIAFGKTEQEREARFISAFNSFAVNPKALNEASALLNVIHHEQQIIRDGLRKGLPPEVIYEGIGTSPSRQFNCITGGGCSEKFWWTKKGRYLILAEDDFDHFGQNAWIAYFTGHEVAMHEAFLAKTFNDPKRLEIAYAMNAFASHFLSDRFSTGHIRTPRVELPAHTTPSVTGSLLSNYMHGEDSKYGLHVRNEKNETWVAYGDKHYFCKSNERHRQKLHEAMQASAQQVFVAFQSGMKQKTDALYAMIPQAIEIGYAAKHDIASLFYWDPSKQKLMRRKNLKNVFDKQWTSSWFGWSTLVELTKIHGLPTDAQSLLARSKYAKEALKLGLITDPNMVDYIKHLQR